LNKRTYLSTLQSRTWTSICLPVRQGEHILPRNDGHLEILQRECGLLKLEKASKDLCSQFYGVTYGPKGIICDTFEPLSFEKNVQWLQTVEKNIQKHHLALRLARMKAAKAIERVRKGNIHLSFLYELVCVNYAKSQGVIDTVEGTEGHIAQRNAYKSFDDAGTE